MFAGLFTQGVIDAGFDVVGVCEDGPFGTDTARLNFPQVPIYTNPESWPVDQWRDQHLDLVYGNPPCAGFSHLNPRRGIGYHTNVCLDVANNFGQRVLPRVFMIESVVPLFKDGLPMVEAWEAKWRELGYNTCRLVESAAHLGLPQRRKRAVFVAAKANLDFSYPIGRVGAPETDGRSAIGDLEPVQPGSDRYLLEPFSDYQRSLRRDCHELTWHVSPKVPARLATLLPYLLPNQRFESIPDEVYEKTYWAGRPADKRGKPGLMYRRQAWDKTCAVIPGASNVFHPDRNRFLTVREQARMMGVPDTFKFSDIRTAYAELGKAVSPIVGEWLANHAVEFVRDPAGRAHKNSVNLVKGVHETEPEK